MKKTVLFLGLLGVVTSCSFDDTPKCDDKEVLQLVGELGIPKRQRYENLFFREHFPSIFQKLTSAGIHLSHDNTIAYKEYSLNNFNKAMEYIKENKNNEDIEEEYQNYFEIKASNIRSISSDKENKKCECEATINFGNTPVFEPREVYYTAQKNTDGQVYVELLHQDN